MKRFAVAALAVFVSAGAALAQPVSTPEWATHAVVYAADLPKILAANQVAYDHNVNPLADQSRLHSEYDQSDLFFGSNGRILPGYAGLFGGGDASGGSSGGN